MYVAANNPWFSPPPPPKKVTETSNNFFFLNERTYRDGMAKKQPNKVGITPQYSYGLSSLAISFAIFPIAHTHTHTNSRHATPPISPADIKWQLQHFTMQHMTPSHYNLSSTAIHTLDYIHIPLTPHVLHHNPHLLLQLHLHCSTCNKL